jgi:hypothetical protein
LAENRAATKSRASRDDIGVRRPDLQVLILELIARASVKVEERRDALRACEVCDANEPDQRQNRDTPDR